MKNMDLQPVKGSRDLYPQDFKILQYIFNKIKQVADLFGYQQYDGPIFEPIDLYLSKTSEELIKQQSFIITDKKGNQLMLRPEMTPTLARMIAFKKNELNFPIKYFNLGLRYRYEAPQKGRAREFYQADFDIIGSDNIASDIDILNLIVKLLISFGLTEKDFTIYINSRAILQNKFISSGFNIQEFIRIIKIIDKTSKLSPEIINNLYADAGFSQNQIKLINNILSQDFSCEDYFINLFQNLKIIGINQHTKIDPYIVRGLDYYTGLVFEVKSSGSLNRSIIGGGRYDNLIEKYDPSAKIPGIGFAFSDVILIELLSEKKLLPVDINKKTGILITIFSLENYQDSLKTQLKLLENNIPCSLYPSNNIKLDKQLKYADKNNFQYVIIVGPEEVNQNSVKLKNMSTGQQETLSYQELINLIHKTNLS